MTLNEFSQKVHAANIKWWQNIDTGEPIERNRFELIALVISEISECLEGERKNMMDDKLPHRRMAEVEMADAYIRLLDYSAGFGHSLNDHFKLITSIPKNKGEALFRLTAYVIKIPTSFCAIESALCYISMYCEKHNYDLHRAIAEKMEFNSKREDHTHEAQF